MESCSAMVETTLLRKLQLHIVYLGYFLSSTLKELKPDVPGITGAEEEEVSFAGSRSEGEGAAEPGSRISLSR